MKKKWPLRDRYFAISQTITFRQLGINKRQVITIFNLYYDCDKTYLCVYLFQHTTGRNWFTYSSRMNVMLSLTNIIVPVPLCIDVCGYVIYIMIVVAPPCAYLSI